MPTTSRSTSHLLIRPGPPSLLVVLVVCFDDFMWFGTDDDRAALRSFVTERLATWRLNVAVLYVVGISGRTFESFPVPHL